MRAVEFLTIPAIVLATLVGSTGFALRLAAETEQLAARRQLKGAEIRRRLVGLVIHYKRTIPGTGGRPTRGAFWAVLRPDGSFLTKCEYYSEAFGEWRLCTGRSRRKRVAGYFAGIWSIRGDLLCTTAVNRGYAGLACYRLYIEGGRIKVEVAEANRQTVFPGVIEVRASAQLNKIGHVRTANTTAERRTGMWKSLLAKHLVGKFGDFERKSAHKAIAACVISARGKPFVRHWGSSWNWRTLEDARYKAAYNCRKFVAKSGVTDCKCKIVRENDTWLGIEPGK